MQISRISNTTQTNNLTKAKAVRPMASVSFQGSAQQKVANTVKKSSIFKRFGKFLLKTLKTIGRGITWPFKKIASFFSKEARETRKINRLVKKAARKEKRALIKEELAQKTIKAQEEAQKPIKTANDGIKPGETAKN